MKSVLLSLLLVTTASLNAQDAMFDICPIKNSEKIPSATVLTIDGEAINLAEYIGDRAVVLVFYRGGWCPYCIRHLGGLQEVKSDIDSLGFEIIAITPDHFSNLDTSIVEANGLDYKLFSDTKLEAIRGFGIGWHIDDDLYIKYRDSYEMDVEWWTGSEEHVLPVPSVFIIKDGVIQFQHVDPNYSQRLSPDLLLNLIQAI